MNVSLFLLPIVMGLLSWVEDSSLSATVRTVRVHTSRFAGCAGVRVCVWVCGLLGTVDSRVVCVVKHKHKHGILTMAELYFLCT